MTSWTLIRRSLTHHARAQLGTLLGVAVGGAVLTGALLVGDSVRGSLRDLALARLGRTEVALPAGDRFFRSVLANDLAPALKAEVAPVIQLAATAATPDDSARANQVQVLGVDERFWRLAETPSDLPSPGADEVLLNERLARQLNVEPGDVVLVRVGRPSALSRETPLTPQEDSTLALRLTVAGVVPASALGPFSLQPSQMPPLNAFVHLGTLQQRLMLEGRANLLLAAGPELSASTAQDALRQAWAIADVELDLRLLPSPAAVQLQTPRVFLEPATVRAALPLTTNAEPILTYFVNELSRGDLRTPYSMVTAAGPPFTPAGLSTNEIVLSDWLADDLQAGPGDRVDLRYYVLGAARRLEEQTASFRVHSILPLASRAVDRDLMPEFPGIEKAESTRDWDPSLPVAMDRIRPQDETYWRDYRGTPKALISLAAGQALWTNRFGDLTAIRYPIPAGTNPADEQERLAAKLRAGLDPEMFGLRFEPVREQALASAAQSQDFGGLFLGFSFFLILSALLLVALLFRFAVERRAEEIGILLAVGFRPRQVGRLLLGEAVGLAVVGSALGLGAGTFYARAMILGLSTLWQDAVGTSALAYHASTTSLIAGGVAGAVVAIGALALALRRQVAQPARVLLSGQASSDAAGLSPGRRRVRWVLGAGAIGGGTLLALQALVRGDTASAGTFFGAGALGLLGGLALAGVGLDRLARTESVRRLSLAALGLRGAGRRRGRSAAVVGLLASGSFLVAAIGVFRLDPVRDAADRSAGTGGFVLMGEATFPVVHDLNTVEGRDFYAFDTEDWAGVSVVAMRVRDGDEASCLNLNRARQPRLLGVEARLLAERGAFTFAEAAKGLDRAEGWRLLETTGAEGTEIPAIGDLNSILWAMGRKVGDRLTYTDERGRPFQVRIVGAVANSILQGNLLIDERAFQRLFPSEPGYRMFLVDAPSDEGPAVAARLTRGLREAGVEFAGAADRLNAFNAVQNTYLGTFQLLGGLGLVLGSVGLGVVVLRNVLERRGELALLLAVGFRRPAVRRMVVTEHAALLVAGLALGVASAGVAVLPNVLSPTSQVPYLELGLTLGAVLVSGLIWTWLAAVSVLRGRLLDGLRNE